MGKKKWGDLKLCTWKWERTLFLIEEPVVGSKTHLWLTKFDGLILHFRVFGENFYSQKSKMAAKLHDKKIFFYLSMFFRPIWGQGIFVIG